MGKACSTPRAAVVFGTGHGLVAASEAALLLKEVAGVPAEGMETREGATSGMYALGRDQLVLALPVGSDPIAEEAVEICSGQARPSSRHHGPTEWTKGVRWPLTLLTPLPSQSGWPWHRAAILTARIGTQLTNRPPA